LQWKIRKEENLTEVIPDGLVIELMRVKGNSVAEALALNFRA